MIEAMKQALEALEMSRELDDRGLVDFQKYGLAKDKDILVKLEFAITALRQAIEQAEKQEPVGVVGMDVSRPHMRSLDGQYFGQKPDTKTVMLFKDLEVGTKLYTAPQPQQAEKHELLAWKNAATRIGEELSSVGPAGYYNMTAEQWLSWALDQQPNGKHSLPQPQREWVGLEDEDVATVKNEFNRGALWAEKVLKEKNT